MLEPSYSIHGSPNCALHYKYRKLPNRSTALLNFQRVARVCFYSDVCFYSGMCFYSFRCVELDTSRQISFKCSRLPQHTIRNEHQGALEIPTSREHPHWCSAKPRWMVKAISYDNHRLGKLGELGKPSRIQAHVLLFGHVLLFFQRVARVCFYSGMCFYSDMCFYSGVYGTVPNQLPNPLGPARFGRPPWPTFGEPPVESLI